MSWEYVYTGDTADSVKRFKVPGGWLYLVERRPISRDENNRYRCWHPPVFVPEVTDEGSRQSG